MFTQHSEEAEQTYVSEEDAVAVRAVAAAMVEQAAPLPTDSAVRAWLLRCAAILAPTTATDSPDPDDGARLRVA